MGLVDKNNIGPVSAHDFLERVQEELADFDNNLSKPQRKALTEMIEMQLGQSSAAKTDSEYELEEAAGSPRVTAESHLTNN